MVQWRVRVGAYGLARSDGHVLLARVAADDPDGGLWTLPGGGLDPGESPTAAMIREFEEETGLTPSPGPILGVCTVVIPHADGDLFQGIRIVYEVEASGEPVAEVNGSTDLAAWIPEDDLPPSVNLVGWALDRALGP